MVGDILISVDGCNCLGVDIDAIESILSPYRDVDTSEVFAPRTLLQRPHARAQTRQRIPCGNALLFGPRAGARFRRTAPRGPSVGCPGGGW